MLKVVSVKNYQAIKKAVLDLVPGINVLEGPSDVGKSCIVRALTGLFYQQSGGWFVRNGAKKVEVTVENEDHTVTWTKGKTTNKYELDGTVIDKPGRTVPEEVVAALRIKPVDFGAGVTRQLNTHQQGELGFLIEDDPANGARILGSMTGAAALATAVRQCSADVSNLARKVSESTRQVATAKERLKGFEDLDAREQHVEQLQATLARLVARFEKVDEANELVQACRSAAQEIKTSQTALAEAEQVCARLQDVESLAKRATALEAVWWLLEELGSVEGEAEIARGRMLAAATTAQNLHGVEELYKRAQQLDEAHSLLAELTQAGSVLDATKAEHVEAKDASAQADAALVTFQADNPRCPLCGGEWGSACP